MNLQQHIIEWLDSIGADGLMFDVLFSPIFLKSNLKEIFAPHINSSELVPAYRHADGTFHTSPPLSMYPCKMCKDAWGDECLHEGECEKWDAYQSWLSRKGEAK